LGSRRTWTYLIATVLAALIVGCGGDDDDGEGTDEASSGLERYCELSRELDEAGSEKFEALESDPNATRADFEAAERELYEENETRIEEAQEVAPEEISDDVAVLVQALRARAGLGGEVPAGAGDADRRVQEFEAENCDSG
jgi:hypothetical protein